MITITGGKLTTWRRMAKLTVDRLVEREARDAPCRTQEIPLGAPVALDELPAVEGVPTESYPALAARYGHAAHDVLALAAERGELAQPIVAGMPDLLAEAALAARMEQARSIGDVLLRRTRLGLLAAHELLDGEGSGGAAAGTAPVRRVAATLAKELGWSDERTGRELALFSEEARAEGLLGS
jgi:glycerol-3-phosphate dehydrogenase